MGHLLKRQQQPIQVVNPQGEWIIDEGNPTDLSNNSEDNPIELNEVVASAKRPTWFSKNITNPVLNAFGISTELGQDGHYHAIDGEAALKAKPLNEWTTQQKLDHWNLRNGLNIEQLQAQGKSVPHPMSLEGTADNIYNYALQPMGKAIQTGLYSLDAAVNPAFYAKVLYGNTPVFSEDTPFENTPKSSYGANSTYHPFSWTFKKAMDTISPSKWYGAANSYYHWLKGDYGVPTLKNWYNNAHGIWSDENQGFGQGIPESRTAFMDTTLFPASTKIVGKTAGKTAGALAHTPQGARAGEYVMRTVGAYDGHVKRINFPNFTLGNLYRALTGVDYILTGNKARGPKGEPYRYYSASFAESEPQVYTGERMSGGSDFGLDKADWVDTYFHQVTPEIPGVTKASTPDVGPLQGYLNRHPEYQNVQTYILDNSQTEASLDVSGLTPSKVHGNLGTITTHKVGGQGLSAKVGSIDAGGHNIVDYAYDGQFFGKPYDIWKYNPEEYTARYDIKSIPKILGLKFLDATGKPFITTTSHALWDGPIQ